MARAPKLASSSYSLEELLECSTDRLEELDYERLSEASAAVVAKFLQRLEVDQRRDVLRILRDKEATDVLAEMDAEDSAEVVGAMRESRGLEILEEFDPDDAADVVGELADEDRSRLLEKLEPSTAQSVKSLLSYDRETAGGIMTPEFAAVEPTPLSNRE